MNQAAINERLKLMATALNNLALALVVTGVVGPYLSGQVMARVDLVGIWVAYGLMLHVRGHIVLGYIR